MNALHKLWLPALALALLAAGLLWISQPRNEQGQSVPPTADEPVAVPLDPAPALVSEPIKLESAETGPEIPKPSQEPAPLSVDERNKEVDREHMRLLHTGIFEFYKVHGHFPEYLSQLVPEFVDASALYSPRSKKAGMNAMLRDHADPGNARPSYGFEFSNVPFRDGRTFAEIKEVQRAEWGDAVPILRAFGYDKVINMSYGGDLYETALNWEWDPATLDVVAARGWGAGLTEGEFTEVRVLGANGQPVSNAPVWADGRNYSFDLPNRFFLTDANGIARIPLGADLDRTQLVLRVEGNGIASPAVEFPRGQPPERYELKAEPARTVGGQVLDAAGKPLADTWVYLKRSATGPDGGAGEAPGASLGVVKTDAFGRWTASLHPDDAAAFNLAVGTGAQPPKYSAGQPVDAHAAAANNAVLLIQTGK